MKENMSEQWIKERSSQTLGSVILALYGQVAFSVGRHVSAFLSMDWEATIGGFQVLVGILMSRTENGPEIVTIMCFKNAIAC